MKKNKQYILIILLCIIFLVIINQEKYFTTLVISFLILIFISTLVDYKFSLLLYLALYPITARTLILGYIPGIDFSFNRIFVFILFIGYIIYRKNKRLYENTTFIKLLFVLIFIDFFSSLFADSGIQNNISRSISFTSEVLLLPLIYFKVFSRDEINKIIISFSIGLLFLSISGIIEHYTNLNILYSFQPLREMYYQLQRYVKTRDYMLRIRGRFIGPVQFAGFIPTMLMGAVSLFLIYKRKKLYPILLTFLVILNGFFTLSRTATLTVLSFFLLLVPFSKIRARVIFVIGIVMLASVFFLRIEFRKNLEMTLNPISDRFSGINTIMRVRLIQKGIPMIVKSNPFGIGYGESLWQISDQHFLFRDLANFYVSYGLSKGVIWMLFFICLICYLLVDTWKLFKEYKNPLLAVFFAGFSASFLGLFAYSEIYITLPIILIFYLTVCRKKIRD